MSPENWTLALPFTKNSNYNILSASAFVTPRSFLQIHQSLITLSFKTTSISPHNELSTTLTIKIGSAMNEWDLLTLTTKSSTHIITGVFLVH
ncbi:hypothetical protein BofuT4_uP090020.1 [Botrytis cinerea T4]|uniref:Uncharacterized protein n=1 Tax=Botryotinia fuckeliana (strain T4) TaxID=999810 RepID=G2YFA8_BOTF4|nr:hypothetical protein BofuT4_uP090020.1 [Botrytis cinerea T4]